MAENAPTPRARATVRATQPDAVPEQIRDGPGARRIDAPDAPPAPVPRPAPMADPHALLPTADTAPLARRIVRGDREAFAAFYEAWFDRCYAMARSLTGRDESFCLDVVQETMLRVARRVREMESDLHLARWMVRATHSCAIDLLRKERRARAREREAARPDLDPSGLPQPALGEQHDAQWLKDALGALDEHERGMLRLRFAQGATLEAVGRDAGSSGHAAHGRIRRLLARLRALGAADS